ncbi:hypothetical protein SDC9_155772 [bioreactor metagenome]|uniref:Uncharacterized protein n=1 Tax=bioreactor metagenome TaxID=1076179 RepID=A0A645F3R4_9ZZZZ
MGSVGRANADGVDVFISQQVLIGGVGFTAVLLGQFSGPFLIEIEISAQFDVGVIGVLRNVSDLGDLPASNDSYVEHLGKAFLPVWVV